MSRWHRVALFIAGVLPGPIVVALVQRSLYGSPLRSGYGDLGPLFSFANAAPNLRLYGGWLAQTHGPWLAVATLAPTVCFARKHATATPSIARRPAPSADAQSNADRRPTIAETVIIWFSVAFFFSIALLYLFYAQFDNWTYTRFLLPALPFVILIGVWAVRILVQSSAFGDVAHPSTADGRSPIADVALVFLFAFVAVDWATRARGAGVFDTKPTEQRYVAVAHYIDATTPKDTIVIGVQHTGALHYYANRETVRYDWVEQPDLDPIVREIESMGRGPLIVLDDWELEIFRKRFAGQEWGALDWPPRAELDVRPIPVRIYDPADRARYRAGKLVETKAIKRGEWLR